MVRKMLPPSRTYLFLCCGLLAGTFVHSADTRETGAPQCDRKVHLAVVGAGPAGTYAAYKLRHIGRKIELFEYSNRIGGRYFTGTLPNVPDVHLEYGGMRFIDRVQPIIQGLVKDLNLTQIVFTEGRGRPGRMKYFMRGKSLSVEEVKFGDVPYALTPEEKKNQARIQQYYLEKLTGYKEDYIPPHQLMSLKVFDGRHLYKLKIDEALDLVASSEGKAFAKALSVFSSPVYGDSSAVNFFDDFLGAYTVNNQIYTVKEGMCAVPHTLTRIFLQASSDHKVTLQRKLDAIENRRDGSYRLTFFKTTTKDGYTRVGDENEYVCAKQVILALPQRALSELKWKPLLSTEMRDTLNAVRPMKAHKVFMTFPTQWWRDTAHHAAYVVKSYTYPFEQMYDWKQSNITGEHIMIASYADGKHTAYEEDLNQQGGLIPGSAPEANHVSTRLKEELLEEFATVFKIARDEIPEPDSASSQFWTSYPFGCGWCIWRAGYNFNDVGNVIQKPSQDDDVFIVGSDFAFGHRTSWAEGAFTTVDSVITRYFL